MNLGSNYCRHLARARVQDKGGLEGIWVNNDGYVAETCMGNVAIVDQAGVMRSPPYDGTILAGTTLLRAFALAPQLVKVRETRQLVPLLHLPHDSKLSFEPHAIFWAKQFAQILKPTADVATALRRASPR